MSFKNRQTRMLQSKFSAGTKVSRHEADEFGLAKKGFIFCPLGEAVYYKKSWHNLNEFFLNPPDTKKDKDLRFKVCPVHELLKRGQYEGEVIIKSIPFGLRKEILGMIKNSGELAMSRDVLDRVLEVKSRADSIRFTTSENQLAQKIARKVEKRFGQKVSLKITRAKGSDVVRVTIDFLDPRLFLGWVTRKRWQRPKGKN